MAAGVEELPLDNFVFSLLSAVLKRRVGRW